MTPRTSQFWAIGAERDAEFVGAERERGRGCTMRAC